MKIFFLVGLFNEMMPFVSHGFAWRKLIRFEHVGMQKNRLRQISRHEQVMLNP